MWLRVACRPAAKLSAALKSMVLGSSSLSASPDGVAEADKSYPCACPTRRVKALGLTPHSPCQVGAPVTIINPDEHGPQLSWLVSAASYRRIPKMRSDVRLLDRH